jgi:hypothetical protein
LLTHFSFKANCERPKFNSLRVRELLVAVGLLND